MNSQRAFVLSKWLSRLIVGYFTAKSLLNGIYGRILRGCLCGMLGGRWEGALAPTLLRLSRVPRRLPVNVTLQVLECLTGTAHGTAPGGLSKSLCVSVCACEQMCICVSASPWVYV